jgi:hypothetical protein
VARVIADNAANEGTTVTVVVVVTQVVHELGHDGGGVVLVSVPEDIHSGTDLEVVAKLFESLVEELVEPAVDEDVGKGAAFAVYK